MRAAREAAPRPPPTPGGLLPDRNMRRLAQQLALGDTEAVSDDVDAYDFGLGEHGEALGAVAVGPFHGMGLLTGGFYEILEKGLLVGGKVGHAETWTCRARKVKGGGGSLFRFRRGG